MERIIIFLVLHRILVAIEKDPDGFVLRNLPFYIRRIIRHHAKWPADAVVDCCLAVLLRVLQPRRLRQIGRHEVRVEPQIVLDVFGRGAPGQAPVILFVHGGVWSYGNRFQYHGLGQRLAAEGFVSVIVGYETWPAANASQQVQSVCRAICHAKTAAASWGGDASKLYVCGQSSGANISALALMNGSGVSCTGFIGSEFSQLHQAPHASSQPGANPPR